MPGKEEMPVTRSVSSRQEEETARATIEEGSGQRPMEPSGSGTAGASSSTSKDSEATDTTATTGTTTTSGATTDATTTSGATTDATVHKKKPVPSGQRGESSRIAYIRAQLEEARLRTALARAIYEEESGERQDAAADAGSTSRRVEDWIEESTRPIEDAEEARPPAVTAAGDRPRIPEEAHPSAITATGDRPRISEEAHPPAVTAASDRPRAAEEANLTPIEKDAAQELHSVKEAAQAHILEKGTSPQQNAAAATVDIAALASAFAEVARGAPRYAMELPTFDGAGEEWLQFKAAYRDSERYYSKTENRARIRRSLRGQAKEAVGCMFFGETDPKEIVEHLEIRFGRPDSLVNAELEKIKQLPRVKESARDTCIFASKVCNIVATIRALGKENYLRDTVAVNNILGKFNYTLQHSWFQYAKTQEKNPDLVMLCEFLKKEAEMCATLVPHEEKKEIKEPPQFARRPQRTHVQNHASPAKEKCPYCENAHTIEKCDRYASMEVSDRWTWAKENHLCFRCLRRRSLNHRCKYRACGKGGCTNSHHRLLHTSRPAEKKEEDTQGTGAVVMSTQSQTPRAYLKVVPVVLTGPAGRVNTHALLDEGSTITLIDRKITSQLGVSGPVEPINIEAVAGARIDAGNSRRIEVTIRGLHHHQEHRVTARTIDNLNLSPQSVTRSTISRYRHLEDIEEDLALERAQPTLLIGQDNWHLIVSRALRCGSRGQPVASLTHLGWVLHGVDHRHKQRVHFVQRATIADNEDNIEKIIKEYFELDSVGITPRLPTDASEQRALQILEETSKRLEDGRFETGLLWKEDHREVPDSRGMAVKRLLNIERRLDRDPALKEAYEKQVQHLLDSGYAEPVTGSRQGTTWYLPHFAVVNPAKPKPRIVHDAAARVRGTSLNDMLLPGPDLLQSLPGVLMRFRQLPVAVTADIKEMFLQIKIRREDRDALSFLWRGGNREEPPREYRMTSVVFGAASSPCTAIYIKNKNAQEQALLYPEAADAIVRNHYMDDYLQSFENEEQAAVVAKQVSDVHKLAHFHLRGWTSNAPAAIANLQAETPSGDVRKLTNKDGEKVLGLRWRPAGDTLGFDVKTGQNKAATTKREALRVAMSIFDPLGLITPVTIHAKHLLQETWRLGLQWDEPLTEELEKTWRGWLSEVKKLELLEVPRAYGNMARASNIQLHTFTDASQSAYAAASYWRITDAEGDVHVSLAAAKGRVGPLKFTSIPRLEIQAALLGARLAQHVQEEHDFKPSRRVFWTDSRTVLSWLQAGSRNYKPFVAHRVAEIEEITKVAEWRWVPSKENVADDATRDIPQDFDERHRWFGGPAFLYKQESEWPAPLPACKEENTGEERVNAATASKSKGKVKTSEALPDIRRFSSWLRLVRATGRVLQFIEICKKSRQSALALRKRNKENPSRDAPWKPHIKNSSKKTTEYRQDSQRGYLALEGAHIQRAEALWVMAHQEDSFPEEISALTGGSSLPTNSRLRQLSLKIEDGIVKIKSRIAAAEGVTVEQRSPAVLDGNHPYARLYIEHIHRSIHHGGVEATANEVLQRFWMVRLRPTVRNVLKSCTPCRVRRAAPLAPPTGDLPQARLAHHHRPFTFVGLDYFGALTVTVGRRHEKRYVALFTCLTSRAVHLEVSANLTTDSAIMALRRMMARRGCPTEIWSDNGTNLRGADAELKRAALEATKEAAANYAVQWRYIPPGAPFMGGAWERMVRSVKTALYTVLKERHPPEEVLHTLLTEVEHTVNSRPLTHVSVSPEDPTPLTPNHLLLGGPSRVPVPGAFTESDTIGRRYWRHSQQLANQFWARWVREALPLLQKRRQPLGKGIELRVGDIVIIADGTLPRNTWPKGVIVRVFPGEDGVTRVADIKTAAGIVRRPAKKIVWLQSTAV